MPVQGLLYIVRAGGWFMRKAERELRMRSFIAHYLKARETFQAGGTEIQDMNDP